MSLQKYKRKRDLTKSPEPSGGVSKDDKLRFVVQKHHASHLHYDFRLEMDGVLKSWAVPKGPSTDPEVKRLAMMVEDHPYDYKDFEGIIPSGYGAGTVIIWDEGTYEPAEDNSGTKAEMDKALRHELHKGKLKFILHGKKLKGEYALIKAKGRGENAWLLFKLRDKYALKDDITEKDKSVVSKKTLEQVEKSTKNFYGSQRVKESTSESKKEKELNKRADVRKAKKKNEKEKIGGAAIRAGKKSPFPARLSPMLATLVKEPFDDPGWIYEIKWDGYRTLAFCKGNKAELKSRNDKSFNKKFYSILKAVEDWSIHAVIDGEIAVLDDNGKSDFGGIQNWRSEADGNIYYYVFDILWLDGYDLTELPLSQRREILMKIVPSEGIIRMSEEYAGSGIKFFEAAKDIGLEGIIAKKASGRYYPGTRTNEWLKIKANKRQEMVIGGYTINDDTSKLFSALLVGVFDKGKLIYSGKVGTGFNHAMQKDMMKKFEPLVTETPPFTSEPDYNKPSRFRPNPPHAKAVWLKPELVCEVSYSEMTTDGVMRHPSFEGMREDKRAVEVKAEIAKDVKEVRSSDRRTGKLLKSTGGKQRKTLLNPTEETQVKKVGGHELKFPNLSKVFWPEEKITKRDMINYYYRIAPFILPYLRERPQSLNRFPNGIYGESFYQKDVTGKAPAWIKTYEYHSDGEERDKHFMVATDEASLLYMAGLGCIEMNPWSSTINKPGNPDWCIIDLDPAKNSFDQVIEAARVTHDILTDINVTSCVKTSGSTGIHIYIPLNAKYTYEESKEFARMIAKAVHRETSSFTSIERAVKDRKGKMYIDFLQNRPQATLASAYSLRPKPGATVSMPLEWDEVRKGLKMSDFNIFNAVERAESLGDIFKPVLGKGIDLKKAISKLKVKS